MPEIREVLSTDATVMDAVVAVIGSSIFIHEILQSVGCKDIKQSEHDFVHARGHVHMTSAQGGRGLNQKYGNHILDLRRSCKHCQYYNCQIEFNGLG